ncbi:MAG: DUF362 domain-containing protein [Candidatus Latescibacterota bacterium]|nr:MAG: DUF362 domain-containing protein [Candidatus Latescibacterota bacterium]
MTAKTPEEKSRQEQVSLERRKFLKQAGTVAGLTLASGWAALAPPKWPLSLRDPDGERGKPRARTLHLPEGGFVVEPLERASLGVARGGDVPAMVRAAVDGIGGIARYVGPGDVVLIKPNVAFERPAVLGATTNPEVLAALIHLVREAGAKEVRVVDNPIESPESCFIRSGIQKAAVDANARVYLPSAGDFETVNVPGATWIENWPFFWRPFKGVTKVIGVSPVKDHNLCRASMTTKNWYGLLGGRRNQFHQDIHGIIADLALMMRPTFVLLDGSRVLFRSGPTGGSLSDVREGRTLVACVDSLAADAFGWDDLLERKGEELPAYFAKSAARGLGNPDWRRLPMREAQIG